MQHFLWLHSPNPCCIVWSRQQEGIGLHVNANKTEYMYFKQEENISTLSDEHLKLVDKFMCLGTSVSSIASDVYIHLVKVWYVINRLLIIWKSDLSYKI